MLSQDIRRNFLHYFKTQSHTIVPSSPVVPTDDPTILFTNAGMNQFKDVFLGKAKREYTRATTSQKCIRAGGKHNDLENVGHTSRHVTFFEMLGNFSFGDYFKKEAIAFAWDLATHIWGLDGDRIWATVYQDDEEAIELWKRFLPEKRIVRFGEESNFWAMGDTGPCGPCSELLYDRGSKYSEANSPLTDLSGERFLEFWNLVFMQYNRDVNKTMTPLPKPCIDTGAGLERVVALKMGVDSIFQIDIFKNIIEKVESLSGKRYNPDDSLMAPCFHIIADHLRALCFAIADGAQPSNTERGYILRKILRRAFRHGRQLGFENPFMAFLVPSLIETMGEDYPELKSAKLRIEEILTIEEENFITTLKRGGNLLQSIIQKSKDEISAEDAFKLKDTYGFPLEEVMLIAKDAELKLDLAKINRLEEEAKEKSRQSSKQLSQQFEKNFFSDFSQTHGATLFTGYKKLSSRSKILAIVVDGEFKDEIKEGEKGLVILDKTPFYAEKGGQIGDSGAIFSKNSLFTVQDTKMPYNGIIIHLGEMKKGRLKKQAAISCQVDNEKRQNICNNHSATHLLHWALNEVLGEHVRQAGSLVEETRLRFDFNHHKPLTKEELQKVEELVNLRIRENSKITTYEVGFDEVQRQKEIKQFFGEKYDSKVRVVDIDFSKELCGGTHTSSTGTIGLFKIEKEGSIAAGIRRIEAVTGPFAESLVRKEEEEIASLSETLKTSPAKLKERVLSLLEENRTLATELKKIKKELQREMALLLVKEAENFFGFKLIAKEVALAFGELGTFADEITKNLSSYVILLATKEGGKAGLLLRISPDLTTKLCASDMIKELAAIIKGGGGGKRESAQAGGGDIAKIDEAFKTLKELLKNVRA